MGRVLCLLVVVVFVMNVVVIQVKSETKKQKVLVIYSTEDEKQTIQTRMLDLLIGGFSKDITWTSAEKISELKNTQAYTHVFYVGTVLRELSSGVKQVLNDTEKSIFFIGENIEQVKRFSFLQVQDNASVTSITLLPQNISANIKENEFSMKKHNIIKRRRNIDKWQK
ncbi:hypothetical protein [Bacillus thuringiensis]|uniref:hypothetical protein n=1 Tax=Bacillus thuringiensis TaxID=1428 RepID=UPI00040BCE04|nr:hypothetical protein [Bacillus thuringiensis]